MTWTGDAAANRSSVWVIMSKVYRENLHKYINWKYADVVKCTQEEFDEICKGLDKKNKAKSKTKISEWMKPGIWRIERVGNYKRLYYNHTIYTTNTLDNNKNNRTSDNSGRKAMQLVKEKFKQANKISLKKAFGYTDEDIKICNPKQFYYSKYTKDYFKHTNKAFEFLTNASAIDFSSQYPYNMCGRLPTTVGCKIVEGTVEPTNDFPFAFYLRSGHSAEFGVYDTHKWLLSDFKDCLYRPDDTIKVIKKEKVVIAPKQNWNLETEKDLTMLCKASDYNLTDIYQWAYENRKVDSNAKLIANASIGYMAKADYRDYRLAHLRTVCICRANEAMRQLCEDKIGKNKIVMIQVDGAIYDSPKCFGVPQENKYFGALTQEFNNCAVAYKGIGQYIVSNHEEILKVKHQGFDTTIDGSDIEKPNSIFDITKWSKLERSEIYEEED